MKKYINLGILMITTFYAAFIAGVYYNDSSWMTSNYLFVTLPTSLLGGFIFLLVVKYRITSVLGIDITNFPGFEIIGIINTLLLYFFLKLIVFTIQLIKK